LDETLLHYDEVCLLFKYKFLSSKSNNDILIRPGAEEILGRMSENFEIVIFTAGTKKYADWALNKLNNNQFISHRLYRQHTLPFNDFYIKDLSRLGRNISKTIIVDNIPNNFML
jgi:TFIIF-interacting CTD phosphatase-like protein